MARLPTPGADAGDWGKILNDYLSQVHAADGTLKPNVVGPAALAPNAVNVTNLQNATVVAAKLDAGTGADGDVLVKDAAASGGFKWTTPSGSGGQAVIADGSITYVKLAVTNAPSSGTVLSYDGTGLSWVTPQAAGGSGEANTASNVGTAGIGVFKQKAGADLQFKSINSATPSMLSVTENTEASSIDITLTAGQPNGLATLGADGKVPAAQLPAATGDGGGGGGTAGSFSFNAKSVNSSNVTNVAGNMTYEAAAGDYLLVDASATAIHISLPPPNANANKFIRVKRMSPVGNSVMIKMNLTDPANPTAGPFIDGTGSEGGPHMLNGQYESIEFWSDGTNWYR